MLNKFKKLGLKVSQFSANHIVIRTAHGTAFQSYDSIVAFRDRDSSKLYLGSDWDYSRTTVKHLVQWLGRNATEIRKGLKDGSIILDEGL